jgi:copper chaperone NosL
MRSHATRRAARALQLTLVLFAAACGDSGPRPLIAGEDACGFCRMAISDVRFGAEVRTATGRILTFDAVECLAGYVNASANLEKPNGVWVADYEGGGMVPADSAHYVRGGSLHSPMGRQLTSFAPTTSPAALSARYGGEVLSWRQVLALALTPLTEGGADTPRSHSP